MGIFLNRGNEEFKSVLNSEIYVDKTQSVDFFSKLVNTEQRCVCVSRPRRFGKSVAANMLAAYFEKGIDSRTLFENLKLAECENWDRYLNKFDVVRIDVAGVCSTSGTPENALKYIQEKLIEDLDEAYPGLVDKNDKAPANAMDSINSATGAQFVIIIDEWDVFFRDEAENEQVQKDYVQFLRSLFKDNRSKKFTAFGYLTGILPIKRYNSQSALNNFMEYTMLNPGRLAPYIGFTEDEVKGLCEKYDMPYDELCSWYDGYVFDKSGHIFGPNSVILSMFTGECCNYWSKSVAYDSLAGYISMNFDGLKDAVLALLADERQRVQVDTYENDMSSFKSKDDILTVLIHLGYLSYDKSLKQVFIPNLEVRKCFEETLNATSWSEVINSIEDSEQLLKDILKGKADRVAAAVEKCHRQNTSILKYNDENSLSMVVNLALYYARNEYNVVREMPSGEGFADLVYIPKKNTDKPAIVVELKYDKDVSTAITQIRDKKYPESLKGFTKDIILVGINYDKDGRDGKHHECVIERI